MPLSTHTRRQLGYAEGYLSLGMKAEAAEALAAILPPENDATLVLTLALAVHSERHDWANASAVGAILCEREPHEASHWIQCAYATRRHRDIEAARVVLLRALGLHPQEPMVHFNLACYEAQLGNITQARAFIKTACALDGSFTALAQTDSDLDPLRGGSA